MEELNPSNPFGELLLDLIESQYGGDIDQGIQALVQTSGLSEEEVVGIIKGKHIVEDENLLAAIIDAFPDADEHDLEVIVNVADAVDQDDKKALIEQIEQHEAMKGNSESPEAGMSEGDTGEEEKHYPSEEEVKQTEQYNRNNMNTAEFQRINEIEQKLANFEIYSAISNRLNNLNVAAESLVNEGILPPAHKAMLVGNFSASDDRVARFAQMAETHNVPIDVMLFAAEFALQFINDASQFVEFKDYSLSEKDVNVAQFSASLDKAVEGDIDAIFGDNFALNLID